MHTYHRRLKILDYSDTDFSNLPFTIPSMWEPAMESVSTPIRKLIDPDLRSFRDLRPRRHKGEGNINTQQQQALKDLKSRQEIIIKPADKGGQIVLQDRTNYVLEATRQLHDTTYYRPLTQPMYLETQTMVRTLIDQMKKERLITAKQANYLYGPDLPLARLFYLLPKIHKAAESWTIPYLVPPGRPIVSDCGSESYRQAEFIDYYINPLSHSHPSYVKDTYTFVNKLKHLTVPENTFIFSVDVDSLYTNINTPLGLEAVKKALESSPVLSRPDYFILQFLQLTLTQNDFLFDKSFFLQISGCTMGRKYSPAYADIYLADWEESALLKCPSRPLLYYRYLDDIFGLWDKSETELNHFIHILSSHHPRITLKHTLHLQQVPFLDTIVFFTEVKDGYKTLGTKVYFKDTDRHSLLFSSSYHPRHTCSSIIKSQLIRFHRICSLPHHALFPSDQANFSGKNKNIDQQLIPLVTTFSRSLGPLHQAIKQHFNAVKLRTTPLATFKVIMAYRLNKNVKDMLVHTALNKTIRTTLDPYFTHLKYIFNLANSHLADLLAAFHQCCLCHPMQTM